MSVELDEERMAERADVLWNVDARECEVCHRAYTEDDIGAISADPEWFVDTLLYQNEDVPTELVRIAVIRCPECR